MASIYQYFLLQVLFVIISSVALLNNIPVIFQMLGPANYTPDVGGSQLSGYKLTVGYINQQWLAVQFVGSSLNDVLVIQQNQFYTPNSNSSFAGHIVTYTDCYSDVNKTLSADTNTSSFMTSVGYMKNRNFSLTISRSLMTNNGQDWNAALYGYGISQICFYTGDYNFDISNWQGNYSACYSYEINNLVSTFRGIYLKDFKLNGYTVSLYGSVEGPYLWSNVFFYHNALLYTYSTPPAVILQIGTTMGDLGQDYNIYSLTNNETGDYFGSLSNLTKDITVGGYENSGFTITYQNCDSNINPNISGTNVKMLFQRNISTYDTYDRQLLSTFSFCMYLYGGGSITGNQTDNYCDVVELSPLFPVMILPTNFQMRVIIWIVIVLVLLIN